ncbi:AIPR family protein [Streptomyces niveiscabiei]|uniref:AIPR family protein n=1 Tax=Streptomyces niveiscabiei TaxID=164115 RepID=UPI0029B72559|nr:AIPR family protein [Streptomyces niveiscabiei]MDX3386272.1 AIPR family protein [Streptomyces niveiscabiei]
MPASTLAHLAELPDAAVTLNSRRGFLHDSTQNEHLADLVRHCPEDVGVAGEAIVLWADHVTPIPRPDGRVTLQLHAPQCVNGFQTLAVIARLNRERDLPPRHLDRARPRIEIHTGSAADLARLKRLFHESSLYMNPACPQDNLSLCNELPRIREEYKKEDITVDWRRGIVTGPHAAGHGITTIFRSLACFHPSNTSALAHQVATEEGLSTVWSNILGPAYRSLINEGVHAFGIQRAVESYDIARRELSGLNNSALMGHKLLIKYVTGLIVWVSARRLPLTEMHADPNSLYGWHTDAHADAFRRIVRTAAIDVIDAYVTLYPKQAGQRRWNYQGNADTHGTWQAIADHLHRTRKL